MTMPMGESSCSSFAFLIGIADATACWEEGSSLIKGEKPVGELMEDDGATNESTFMGSAAEAGSCGRWASSLCCPSLSPSQSSQFFFFFKKIYIYILKVGENGE